MIDGDDNGNNRVTYDPGVLEASRDLDLVIDNQMELDGLPFDIGEIEPLPDFADIETIFPEDTDGKASVVSALSAQTARMARHIPTNTIEAVNSVKDSRHRFIAGIGFTRPAEMKEIPPDCRILKIEPVPFDEIDMIRSILEAKGVGAVLMSDFVGDVRTPVLYYLLPEDGTSSNLKVFIHSLNSKGLRKRISIADPNIKTTRLLRVKDNGIMPFSMKFTEISFDEQKELTSEIPSKVSKFQPTGEASSGSVRAVEREEKRKPRKGDCVYLAIEEKAMAEFMAEGDPAVIPNLLQKLKDICSSGRLYITSRDGYIFIINTAEQRAADFLVSIAREFNSIARLRNKCFIKTGEITRLRRDSPIFGINEFQDSSRVFQMFDDDESCGVFVKKDVISVNPENGTMVMVGRHGGTYEMTGIIVKVGDEEFFEVRDLIPKISLKVGGPDRRIGLDKEYAKMKRFLADDEKNLILIKGNAGKGKSTMLSGLVRDDPSILTLSADPSGEKWPGYTLARMYNQVVNHIKNIGFSVEELESKGYTEERFPVLADLKNIELFAMHQLEDQIETIQNQKPDEMNIEIILERLLKALRFLREQNGNLKIVVDDTHFIDRYSDGYLMSNVFSKLLMENFIDGGKKTKIILSGRPEQDSSEAQKNLVKVWLGNRERESTVFIEGIDLNDPKLAREYVYYSLPRELRKDPVTGVEIGPKGLGDWAEEMGRKAGKFPLVMNSYISDLLSEHYKPVGERKTFLEFTEGELKIIDRAESGQPSFMDRLKAVKDDKDLRRHYLEKMEKLEEWDEAEEAETLIRIIALLGGHLTAKINDVFALAGISEKEKGKRIMDKLIAANYLVYDHANLEYRTIHDTFTEAIVQELDPEEKMNLSSKMLALFKEEKTLQGDIRLGLLLNMLPKAGADNTWFWNTLLSELERSYGEVAFKGGPLKGYNLALSVLGIGPRDTANPFLKFALNVLLNPGAASDEDRRNIALIEPIIIKSILAVQSNGMMIGKVREANLAWGKLEKIYRRHNPENNPITDEQILEVRAKAFNCAYFRRRRGVMKKIYERYLSSNKNFPAWKDAICELKLMYRYDDKGDYTEELYQSGTKAALGGISSLDSDELAEKNEAHFLGSCVAPFEGIRYKATHFDEKVTVDVEGKKYDIQVGRDDDVLMQPGVLADDFQTDKLKGVISDELGRFEDMRKNNPKAFTSWGEMLMIDIDSQINAFMGKLGKAASLMSEQWRLSIQMDLFPRAIRAAKLKGDIQVMQAMTVRDGDKLRIGKRIGRDKLIEAIKTYSEQGVRYLDVMSDPTSIYPATLRIQRIRAAGILMESYLDEYNNASSDKEREKIRENAVRYIDTAIDDFKYVMENEDKLKDFGFQSTEIQYYVTSYFGQIMHAINAIKAPYPYDVMMEIRGNSFLDIEAGLAYAEKRIFAEDDVLSENEINRKIEGLIKMAEAIGEPYFSKAKIASLTERFLNRFRPHSRMEEVD